MEAYTSSNENLMIHSNSVKDILIDAMIIDGVVSAEKGAELQKTYYVAVTKKSWISKLFEKDRNANDTMMIVMKNPSR